MRCALLLALLPCLAACYAVDPPNGSIAPVDGAPGRPVAVLPKAPGPAYPAVVTTRGVLAYHKDLQACRAKAGLGAGAGDDVAALQRSIAQQPLRGSVSVSYRSDDVMLARDKIVRECLSQRGYSVSS